MPGVQLTPAEAFVLLEPRLSSPSEAFKIAFLWLVAQGVLRIRMVERFSLLKNRQVPVISVARDPPGDLLAADVVRTVRAARASARGVEMKAVAHAAVKIFGPALVGLKREFILPALVRRRLLEKRVGRILWVFPRTLHEHSPAGLWEKRRIEAVLDQARLLPLLLTASPAEAKAIVLAAGPLLLLVPELKGLYGRLGALDAARQDAGSAGSDVSFDGDITPSPACDHFGGLDFSCFDAGALDLDFSSFDASFDASFSDGGGDGGGHGGGDGGGGH